MQRAKGPLFLCIRQSKVGPRVGSGIMAPPGSVLV